MVFTKNVKHTETNLHLSTGSLFKNVWPFSGHQVLRVKGYPAGNYMLKFNKRNGLMDPTLLWPSGQNSQNAVIGLVRLSPWEWFKVGLGEAKYQLKKTTWTRWEINSKLTVKTMASFWCLYCLVWTYFRHCSGVSIVNFEEVNAG